MSRYAFDDSKELAYDDEGERDEEREYPRVSPGKISRTSRLPAARRAATSPGARPVMRKADGDLLSDEAEALLARAAAGAGAPLPEELQALLEAALGTNLDQVRVHDDAASAEAARAVAAKAYTQGQDIYFAAGQYVPGTASGRKLIAHEVAHTVQARGASAAGLEISHPGDASERQADAFAASFEQPGVAISMTPVARAGILRDGEPERLEGVVTVRWSERWEQFLHRVVRAARRTFRVVPEAALWQAVRDPTSAFHRAYGRAHPRIREGASVEVDIRGWWDPGGSPRFRGFAIDEHRAAPPAESAPPREAEAESPAGGPEAWGAEGDVLAREEDRDILVSDRAWQQNPQYVDQRGERISWQGGTDVLTLYLRGGGTHEIRWRQVVGLHPTPSRARTTPGMLMYFRDHDSGLIYPTFYTEQTTPRIWAGIQSIEHQWQETLEMTRRFVEIIGEYAGGGFSRAPGTGAGRIRRGPRGDGQTSVPEGGGAGAADGPGPGAGAVDGPGGPGHPPPDGQPPGAGGRGGRRGGTRYAQADDYALDESSDLARRRAQWAQRPIQVVSSVEPARAAHTRAASEVPNYPQGDFGYACALDLDSGRTAAVPTAPNRDLASAARARGLPIEPSNGGHLVAAQRVVGEEVPELTRANRGVVGFTAIEHGTDAVEVRLVSGQANTPVYGRERPPASVLAEIQRAAQQLFPDRTVTLSGAGRRQ